MLPGEIVLVEGTDGVSLFALQIAKAAGATVIATSSSDEKLKRVKELGADETINYRRNPDWGAVARSLTGGVGVDHVLDVAGGENVRHRWRRPELGQRGYRGTFTGASVHHRHASVHSSTGSDPYA